VSAYSVVGLSNGRSHDIQIREYEAVGTWQSLAEPYVPLRAEVKRKRP